MAASKTPVLLELYYDVISPYSWLAFEVLCRYRTVWNIDLKLKPFFLGGIMKETSNRPPGAVINKAIYMKSDLERLNKYFQVPLVIPNNIMDIIFKNSMLNTQSFITAVDMENKNCTEELSRNFWKNLYGKGVNTTDPSCYKKIAKDAGLTDELIEKAFSTYNDENVRSRLQEYTKQALELGAFGAPTIVAHVDGNPEVFFGSDRFELIASILGEKWKGPVPKLTSNL